MSKKRVISFLVMILMLFSTFSGVFAFADHEDLDNYLVTHWDFSGYDPCKDKATSGISSDTMKTVGDCYIADGTATIPDWSSSSSKHYLYADESSDLMRTTEDRTIFIIFKSSKGNFANDGKSDRIELVGQNGAVRIGITEDNKLFASTNPHLRGENWAKNDGMDTFTADTWTTVAISYDKGTDGNFTVYSYYKVGNGKWINGTAKKYDTTQTWLEDNSDPGQVDTDALVFGRRVFNTASTWGGVLVLDDVRIYNKALTLGEVSSIQTSETMIFSRGHSLTVSQSIGVNFYIQAAAELQGKEVTATVQSPKNKYFEQSFVLNDENKCSELSNAYKITAEIAAKDMTEELTLSVICEGKTVYSEAYSVERYVDHILENTDSFDDNTVDVVRKLAVYGKYAQKYFECNLENVIGESITDIPPTITDSSEPVPPRVVGAIDGVICDGATVTFENKIQTVFCFTLDGVSADELSVSGQELVRHGNRIYILSPGSSVQALESECAVTLKKGESEMTVSYTPMSYIKEKATGDGSALDMLLRALYAFHVSAKEYLNSDGSKSKPLYGIIEYRAGENKLYNGIELPETWPPKNVDPMDDDVIVPPYLVSEEDGGYRPEVIDITVGRQLFVDDFLIESTDLTTVYHQAEKYDGNPIVSKTGMNLGTSSGGIWYDMDEKIYKMWYDVGFNPKLAYAESTDGINWTPVNVPGTNSNIVMNDIDKNGHCEVFIDYEAEPSQKYKMVMQSFNNKIRSDKWYKYEQLKGSADYNSYVHTLYVSSDGLIWTQVGEFSKGISGDMTTAFYNVFTQKWVNSLRSYAVTKYGDIEYNGRVRYYAETDTFEGLLEWTSESAVFWLKCDENDEIDPISGKPPQMYNFSAIGYESIMLGFFTIWKGPENNYVQEWKIPKKNEIIMSYSRDGFYYDRPDRTPFIGVGDDGEWDKGYLFSSIGGIIIDGDLLYIYYSGFSGYDANGNANGHATQSIGVATLRRDGFASMEGSGELLTRMLTVNNDKKYLFVNIDAPTDSFKAEIIDENGNVVEGYSFDDCVAVGGDSTCQQITWNGSNDLSFLNGENFRIRFSMTDGKFYSFWLSDSIDGNSDGAIAAGIVQ